MRKKAGRGSSSRSRVCVAKMLCAVEGGTKDRRQSTERRGTDVVFRTAVSLQVPEQSEEQGTAPELARFKAGRGS